MNKIVKPKFRVTYDTVLLLAMVLSVVVAIPFRGNIEQALKLVATGLALVLCMNIFYFGWHVTFSDDRITKTYIKFFHFSVTYDRVKIFNFLFLTTRLGSRLPVGIAIRLLDERNTVLMSIPMHALAHDDVDFIVGTLKKKNVKLVGPILPRLKNEL